MTVRVIHALPVVVFAAVGLAACTATEAGEPVTIEPTTTERLAPPVDQPPLDVEPFLDQPCEVLTPEQAAEWTVSNPERVPDDRAYSGPACDFEPDDFYRVSFGIAITNGDGLDSIYQRRDTLQLFEPTDVAGYPGVFNDSANRRAVGNCGLTVGVAEDRALDVLVSVRDRQSPQYADACPVAERIMQQMIETIQGTS